MNYLPVELLSLVELCVCCVALLFAARRWELAGICSYIAVAIVISNIEVMKGIDVAFIDEPVALGNMVYGSISIAIAVAAEIYGATKAKTCVAVGFYSMVTFSLLMVLAMGYRPIDESHIHLGNRHLLENHWAMVGLFSPNLGITAASLISFLVSSAVEVVALVLLRPFKFLRFIRIFLASNMAACLDLFLMNYLAWIIFSPYTVDMRMLFYTYIVSSYPFRFIVACAAYPTVYVSVLMNRGSITRRA